MRQLEIQDFLLETDFLQAYHMVHKDHEPHWSCLYLLRCIWSIFSDTATFNHVYREQNRVADCLAKAAKDYSGEIEFFRVQDLPLNARKLIFLDMIGIPYFRKCCK